jgi:hypothetical protein
VLEQFCTQKFIGRKENKIYPTKGFEDGIRKSPPIKQEKPLWGFVPLTGGYKDESLAKNTLS